MMIYFEQLNVVTVAYMQACMEIWKGRFTHE
ncbi:hypothetical protein Plant_47 [Bacillus phage poppyseed]|uniref:Uncharacterized protein n=2 Tax=Bacillus phage Page TaxID=1406786 RepID=U5PVK6_9CAUD|nr:hypothetical protein Page_47 [Bacillus phage Page]AGY47969.1 hypothetical protein Page_47 [Bacillus phage Page]AGY48064.1 hypothetical protein Plant_47 [Bacillus phage poppyseed]